MQGGRPLSAPPPTDQNFLNFMQFLGKFVCWHLPLYGWRRLLRGILYPPLLLEEALSEIVLKIIHSSGKLNLRRN